MMNKTYVTVLSLLLPFFFFGQSNTAKIDSFIQSVLANTKEIPSVTVAVSKDGEPYYLGSFGYTNVDLKQKSNAESSYYLASVTKSFVGILASILHEDGVIDLNKSISEYAPIKNFKDKTIFKGVTVKDLLSHSSGLSNSLLTWQFSDIGNYNRELMIEILEEKTTKLHNNNAYRYDNLGYNIFDLILSEEFNLSWKDLLRDRLFDPLDMKHTSASLTYAEENKWQLAQPYTSINVDRLPTKSETIKNEATFQAAGGMVSSSEDMQKFIVGIIGSLKGKGTVLPGVMERTFKILTKNSKSSTFIENEGYGLGWNVGEYEGRKAYYHLGGFDGYFAHLSIIPEENMGVAIMVNESHFGDNVGNLIAQYIYDVLLNIGELDSKYEGKRDAVVNRVDLIQNAFEEDRQNRSERTYNLNHPKEFYQGTYVNTYLGILNITMKEQKPIHAQLGILNAVASPSANDDSIRVEFRDGSGRDILFVSNKKEVLAAVYQGYVFIKQ